MTMKVRYNGKTTSYYGFSDAGKLVLGEVYEVETRTVRGGTFCYYKLLGIEGEFNSEWFDIIEPYNAEKSCERTFLAISKNFPILGSPYECYKLEFNQDGYPRLKICRTSAVTGIIGLGNGIYEVKTSYTKYIVKIA